MAIYQDTGDQTTIVGIAGIKSEFNTALTDGDFLFEGDIILPPLVAVTDLSNGTLAINSGYGTETAIRPIDELPLLTGNIDNTSDKLVLYDASTNSHVFVTPAIVNAPEIFRNNGALSGVAPPPFKVGIDYTNGTQYYVNASGNWTAFPPGTTVVLTDLPNGTVSINAGLGGSETAIRPITEQDTLVGAIDEVNDFTTIYDASAQKHVKTPLSALVKDLYRDRGMPNTLMTLSGVATFSRTNFLNWTSRFLILGGGRGAGTLSTQGYYDVQMPSVGTFIPIVGGATGVTVTPAGINMNSNGWVTLYYVLNPGGAGSGSNNFRLVSYQNDFLVPDNWVMVGAFNSDSWTLKLGNGQILKQGTDSNGGITPFDATIDFSVNTDPNTAGTTFTPNTPQNGNVLYISTINGSQWTYNGTAYVSAPPSPDWKITGNTGTNPTTNFVGTTDNVSLNFRTNNTIRQTITNTGDVGIKTTAPANTLHIATATRANTGGIRLPITSASVSQVGQPIGVDTNGDIVKLANAVFDSTIDFSVNANPNTAGTTYAGTPATTTAFYVSTIDGSQWTYNGTAYVPEPIKDLYRDRGMPNTLMTLSGVATFSRTNFLKWTSNFFILGGGRGSSTLSTAGFYQISMPPVGTVISRVGGGNNITVTAEGIQMRDPSTSWSVLYYILNPGGSNFNSGNFRLAGFQSDFIVPDNWVMIATYNPDISTVKIGNGQILARGTDSTGAITPFDATIDFSVNTDPNTAGTTFNPNTPANSNVVYISTINATQWTYNGTVYVSAPASADWNLVGNAGTNPAINFVGTTDNVSLQFRTNNLIRQTISNTGNVGIGTQTPNSRLAISGGTNDLGFYNGTPASLNQGKQAIVKAIDLGVGQGHLTFETYRGGFGGGERMRITDQGNVGIGTQSPTNKLHVPNFVFNPNANDLASIKVEGNYGGGVAFAEGLNRSLIWSDAGRSLNFSTGGTAAGTPERMRITDTGNVVINGAFGTEKLHVNGNIRVTAVPNFATTALAMVSPLVAGCMYTVTVNGAKQLYLK